MAQRLLLQATPRLCVVAAAAASVVVVGAAAATRRRQVDAGDPAPLSTTPSTSFRRRRQPPTPLAAAAASQAKPPAPPDEEQVQPLGRNYREQRFLQFASVEFDGVAYMTPQDFLESVTQEAARSRRRRRALSQQELQRLLYRTPSRWWASSHLFRSLGDEGIISYSEYLFLLCVMAKPKAGFEIAFKMLDLARNQRVDKEEFLVLNRMMARGSGEQQQQQQQQQEQQQEQQQDTTLLLHLFGRSGNQRLDFDEFCRFMNNLQTEVLEIEFAEFSKGLQTISETEFARLLLRYTKLSKEAQEAYVQRIRDKMPREQGIKFHDFRRFFQFLNDLDDFTVALRMFSMAGHSISQEEFQRAVKACVGYTLAPHLVATVFLLFDKDDDGHLSHQEFLSILRDRTRRLSSRPSSAESAFNKFKRCVANSIKEAD